MNSASGETGVVAPYTFATVYGERLSYVTRGRTTVDTLPGIGGVNVLVSGVVAMVFYVSPYQVNFLVPSSMLAGPVTVQLTRDGLCGPVLKVKLTEFAPALFCFYDPADQAIAQRMPDFSLATKQTPARGGQWVILYATGLGNFIMPAGDYEPPAVAVDILRRIDFKVLLDGVPVEDSRIGYAGSVVNYWGLIQINLKLPEDVRPNPEIRIGIGESLSRAGIHMPVEGSGQ